MANLRYAIINCAGEWRVVGERRRIGRYSSCSAATLAGARLALEAMSAGHEVEFLIQDETSQLTRCDPTACVNAILLPTGQRANAACR
jgi:hypothetical protein